MKLEYTFESIPKIGPLKFSTGGGFFTLECFLHLLVAQLNLYPRSNFHAKHCTGLQLFHFLPWPLQQIGSHLHVQPNFA